MMLHVKGVSTEGDACACIVFNVRLHHRALTFVSDHLESRARISTVTTILEFRATATGTSSAQTYLANHGLFSRYLWSSTCKAFQVPVAFIDRGSGLKETVVLPGPFRSTGLGRAVRTKPCFNWRGSRIFVLFFSWKVQKNGSLGPERRG